MNPSTRPNLSSSDDDKYKLRISSTTSSTASIPLPKKRSSPTRMLRLPARRRLHRRVQALCLSALFVLCVFAFLSMNAERKTEEPEFLTHARKNAKLVDQGVGAVDPAAGYKAAVVFPQQESVADTNRAGNAGSALEKAVGSVLRAQKSPIVEEPPAVVVEPQVSMDEVLEKIDLLQAQFLDYLNGEEGRRGSSPRIFGGSLQNLTTPFDPVSTWTKLSQFSQYALQQNTYPKTEFLHLGRFARANLIAYTVLYDKPSLQAFLRPKGVKGEAFVKELEGVVEGLTRIVFPWFGETYKSIREMQEGMGRGEGGKEGIVFTTGRWHFELTIHAIMTLRKVHNCTLPIQVHYGGPNDLPQDMIRAINALPGTVAVDTVTNYFTSETSQFGGWSLKPFALLASSFTTVIFIDADALFFQDPITLLKSTTFQTHGQVFFHDRSLFRNDPVTWFRGINPQYTRYASGLRYMNGLSWHEMESGVMVVDKRMTGNLFALLVASVMNSKVERDEVTYKKMHGDKETYWISWDLLRVPYAFVPTYGGTVGYKDETTGAICGGLFHTDENHKPLWWNGGVVANKHHSQDDLFMKFEYAAFDTDADQIQWVWETPTTPFCLIPRYDWEIVELDAREKSLGQQFVDIYSDMKKDGWKAYLEQDLGKLLD
ncbi:hypothetical protein HDU98_004339 [Podochytrium sp. JEL0797]|nr:hypothetical protein HDU98_004339 [Podochytrium sp. JEL0797]